jgi:amidase
MVGAVSTEGTAPWPRLTDSIGGMAKSAEDLAYLVDCLIDGKNFTEDLPTSWEGMKIGFVNDRLWNFVDFICTADPALIAQQHADNKNVKSKLREEGATVHEDVPFPSMDDLTYDGEDALEQLWSKVTIRD